jgi:hypothetical protein
VVCELASRQIKSCPPHLLRQMVLQMLDISQDRQCVIDSLPIPAVQFHLVPGSPGDWSVYGATFGKVASKKLTIFSYKLLLLVTLGGLILDFVLAPANEADLTVGVELLEPLLGQPDFVQIKRLAFPMSHI